MSTTFLSIRGLRARCLWNEGDPGPTGVRTGFHIRPASCLVDRISSVPGGAHDQPTLTVQRALDNHLRPTAIQLDHATLDSTFEIFLTGAPQTPPCCEALPVVPVRASRLGGGLKSSVSALSERDCDYV